MIPLPRRTNFIHRNLYFPAVHLLFFTIPPLFIPYPSLLPHSPLFSHRLLLDFSFSQSNIISPSFFRIPQILIQIKYFTLILSVWNVAFSKSSDFPIVSKYQNSDIFSFLLILLVQNKGNLAYFLALKNCKNKYSTF